MKQSMKEHREDQKWCGRCRCCRWNTSLEATNGVVLRWVHGSYQRGGAMTGRGGVSGRGLSGEGSSSSWSTRLLTAAEVPAPAAHSLVALVSSPTASLSAAVLMVVRCSQTELSRSQRNGNNRRRRRSDRRSYFDISA